MKSSGGHMNGMGRKLGLIIFGSFGLWFGFTVPFLLFLLTGFPFGVLFTGFLIFELIVLVAQRRNTGSAKVWLTAFFLSAMAGTIVQAIFAFLGGWALAGS